MNREIEIKLLAQCTEHIPSLAILWYEQISKYWVPTASIERAKENLLKHANQDKLPQTFVALITMLPSVLCEQKPNP